MEKKCRIKYFPVSFFSMILGFSGITIAYQKIEEIFKFKFHLSNYLLVIAVVFFIVLSSVYIFKLFLFFDEVKLEFSNPVKLSFFPTISISLLLLSIAFLNVSMDISKYLWISGTVIHFVFTVKIILMWIHHTQFEIKHMNPAWFISPVGNILIPVSGVSHLNNEVSWFFLATGLFFWIILMVIFFNRIIFHHPLPEKLLPTLFIVIAPPAVAFIAFVKLTGEVGDFSKILYYIGLFLGILMFFQFNIFSKLRFYLSWWAYSFPISSLTIASILMYHKTDSEYFKYISLFFFVVLNLIFTVLILKTVVAIYKKEICIEEE